MTIKKIIFLVATLVLGFFAAAVLMLRVSINGDVDHCLDRGGSWHYDIKECSFTENYRLEDGLKKGAVN